MRYNIDDIRRTFDDAVKLGSIQSWSRRQDLGGRYVADEWTVVVNAGTLKIGGSGEERIIMKSDRVVLKSNREAWLFAYALSSAMWHDEAVKQGWGKCVHPQWRDTPYCNEPGCWNSVNSHVIDRGR